ncbi:MAG: EAL domain-containing protein [Lachnospiraceae bacterium]|nr:EAL domain-containing protein [Lachnospiraceae bacterium]
MGNRRAAILIISNNGIGLESLSALLETDFTIYTSDNVSEAEELLAERKIDIVLLNLSQDTEQRISLVSYIKTDEKLRSILLCVLTEQQNSELSNRALTLGANYNFSLPINPSRIKRFINNIVQTFVDDRIDAEENRADETKRAIALLSALDIGYLSVYEQDGYYIDYIGNNALKLLGYDMSAQRSFVNMDFYKLLHPSDRIHFEDTLGSIVDGESTHRFFVSLKTQKTDYQRFKLSLKGFEIREGVKYFALALRRADIYDAGDDDLRAEIAIYKENFKIDLLTGIYNKETFFTEATKLIERNPSGAYVVTVWDIDRFKAINEMFGSEIGDKIIVEFADFFKTVIRDDSECIYGRIESDHFITCSTEVFFERHEERMSAILNGEEKWHSLDYKIYMHAGVYRLSPKEDDITIACDRAMMALQAIKDSYITRLNYFSREMRDAILFEQELIRNAESAIAGGEFFVMYQPIVDSHTKEIVSAEALIRWRKPDGSYMAPGSFVPTFEKNGFISQLDLFVWEQAAKFQYKRREAGKKTVPISVNLSRIDFYNAELFEDLQRVVEEYKLDNSLMKIEVTESAYMDQPKELMNVIERFRNSGHKILMDDFGSGFSSFNMLKDFTVDILKIDMKFMDSIDTSERAGNILYSIIQMAKAIDLEIVAEGVETNSQYEMLRNMDCDLIQGFYFHRPLSEEEFEEKLDANEAEVSTSQIVVKDRVLLIGKDPKKAEELSEILKETVEIKRLETADTSENLLRRSFAGISLILIDCMTALSDCREFVASKSKKSFYSDIPVVIIVNTGLIAETEDMIGNGVLDSIRYPFEKKIVMQRIRRTIDYYGIQLEKRTIGVLKKSMLLRQQLNSFFEDSIAGIARVILDKDDPAVVKEVSYVNERFLELHELTISEALRAKRIDELMTHVRLKDFESIGDAVKESVKQRISQVAGEFDIERSDGSLLSCTLAGSLQYLGNDVKMDIILLEESEKTDTGIETLLDAVNLRSGDGLDTQICRYYMDEDIADLYRKKEDGSYVRELIYDARKSFLAYYGVREGSNSYETASELFDRLRAGEDRLSADILVPFMVNGTQSHKWYRLSLSHLKDYSGKRCALGVMENISRGYDLEHMIWKTKQYDKLIKEDAIFYLEADLTDNRVINSDAFKILGKYGIPEYCSYSEFGRIFDMTVDPEDLEKVRNKLSRERLIREYREGDGFHRISFLAKFLEDQDWRTYQAIVLLDENPATNHVEAGLRIVEAVQGGELEAETGSFEMDALTGLYNRVFFEKKMNRMLKDLDDGKEERNFALVTIGLDNFKKINDVFGHDVGDSLLKTAANIIKGDFGDKGLPGRLGGDEFAVFVPDAKEEEVNGILQRINKDIYLVLGTDVSSDSKESQDIIVTTSIGVVYSGDRRENFHKLYPRADYAMNHAKARGKNRYVVYSDAEAAASELAHFMS